MASTTEPAGSTSLSDGPYGQIILFGDSITEHSFDIDSGFSYAAALSQAYRRRLDVINRGFSGYNTAQARVVLPRFFPTPTQAKVELLIICFGANDACLPHDPAHCVPVDVFSDNLISIITHPIVQAHNPHIVLVTPPPVNEHQQIPVDQAKGFSQLRRTAENTRRYAEACKRIGDQLEKIYVVDIWTAFLRHAGWNEGNVLLGSQNIPVNSKFQGLFTDGVHLTASGYRLVFEEVFKSIKTHCPSLDPDRLQYRYPQWEVAPK